MSYKGLWVPSHLRESQTRPLDRPGLVMYHTIGEIDPDLVDIPRALVAKLSIMDRTQVLAIASNINARLLYHGAAHGPLHQRLEQDLLYADQRERLATVRPGRSADQTVVFTRAGLLLLSKIVLGLRDHGPTHAFDDREIGTCVLMINELLQGNIRGSDEQLMLSSMAAWSFYSPTHIEHVIPRFRRIVNRLFESKHQAVARARELLNLSDIRFDGMRHDEFQATFFAAYLIINAAVAEEKAPILMIEPPLPAFMDEDRVRAMFALRSQDLDAFLDWRYGSWTPDRLRELLTNDVFLQDSTTFRQRPMVRLENRFLLPDYRLAFERFTFGAYWTLFDNFVGDDKKTFSGAWGHAFEEYVLELLAETYPSGGGIKSVLRANVPLPPREIDAVLEFANYTVVIEVKSTLLPVEVRSSLRIETLESWVQERLWIKNGGLHQLAGDAVAARDGLLGSQPRRIYPVLITDEPSFQALGVNRYLGRAFANRFPGDTTVRPLTVITTDELEEFLSCLNDGLVTWEGVLDRRASDRDGWMWTGQALRNELMANGRLAEARLHQSLKREYREFVRNLGGPET